MKPARGVSFFRKIEAHDMIGSIVVPQQTVERLVALQAELLAVGEPEFCDDEDCRRPHGTANGHRKAHSCHLIASVLRPGAWVLLAPRSWVPTPQRDVYAVQTDSILGAYAVSVTDVSKTPSGSVGAYSG